MMGFRGTPKGVHYLDMKVRKVCGKCKKGVGKAKKKKYNKVGKVKQGENA